MSGQERLSDKVVATWIELSEDHSAPLGNWCGRERHKNNSDATDCRARRVLILWLAREVQARRAAEARDDFPTTEGRKMSDVPVLKILDAPGAKLPTKAHEDDGWYDLYAYLPGGAIQYIVGRPVRLPTGLHVAVPAGFRLKIEGRSGLALKGVDVLGGCVDAGYRGEIGVIVMGREPTDACDLGVVVFDGDRIAQFSLEKVEPFAMQQVATPEELGATERGEKGWGSSGR